MGMAGWLFRRVLAVAIFGPLVAIWYLTLAQFLAASPSPRTDAFAQGPGLLVVATIGASITDWLIIRAVKRSMKGRPEGSHRT